MLHLSAFADEIAVDLETQVAVLQSEQITHVELRSAWGINVLDLSDQQVAQVEQLFAAQGIHVAAIGSPIGKVSIDSPFDESLQRLQRAIDVARTLHTPYIRIFSFYPPEGGSVDPSAWR